jgi:hypothetical protein
VFVKEEVLEIMVVQNKQFFTAGCLLVAMTPEFEISPLFEAQLIHPLLKVDKL